MRLLIGNEARGEFRISFGRNDGLRSLALIAAPHAVQLEGWTSPELFDNREALFSKVARSADSFFECFFLPGQGIQGFAFGRGNFCDFIVEARNGDAEILVVKLGEKLGENRQRIGNRAAVHAGMKIAHGAGQFDLIIIQAAQSVGDGGHALGEHRRIGNDERVGFQLFLVFLDVVPKADAADFFFAFDQDFYVDGKLAIHFLDGFEGF